VVHVAILGKKQCDPTTQEFNFENKNHLPHTYFKDLSEPLK